MKQVIDMEWLQLSVEAQMIKMEKHSGIVNAIVEKQFYQEVLI